MKSFQRKFKMVFLLFIDFSLLIKHPIDNHHFFADFLVICILINLFTLILKFETMLRDCKYRKSTELPACRQIRHYTLSDWSL